MEQEIRMKMYRKYKYGKVLIFLFVFVVIVGSIMLIGSMTGFISKEVEHEINYYMGLLLSMIIVVSVSVIWTTEENYNITKNHLMRRLENQNNNLQKFEEYLERNYKIIPEKEKRKLKKLKKKACLLKGKLNLISI